MHYSRYIHLSIYRLYIATTDVIYVYIFRHRFPVNTTCQTFSLSLHACATSSIDYDPNLGWQLLYFVSCILSKENQVKVHLAKGRGVEYTCIWMTTWTFSLPVSQHTSHQMSSTWEGNSKCASELKKRESSNGLKGRS